MTDDEITAGVRAAIEKNSAWSRCYCSYPEIEVRGQTDTTIRIHVQAMYKSPPFNSELVFDLCEFFGTKHIDSDQFAHDGCETCDYGSRYGYDLTVRLGVTP